VATTARGHDMDPRLASEHVLVCPLEEIPSKSFDVVTAIDVIEHVEDPAAFVLELKRIARQGIFVTTPNWTISRCTWPYHLREYTPRELVAELAPAGEVTLFKGTPSGSEVFEVRSLARYNVFNDLRSGRLTSFPLRVWNKLMPYRLGVTAHLGAFVRLA
jgi:hypothetical protein